MKNARRATKPKPRAAMRSTTRRVSGRGDFTDPAVSLPQQLNRIEKKLDTSLAPKPAEGLGSGIGRLAGNFLGQGDLGAQAGNALQKWFGFGDYELVANSLIKGSPSAASSSIPTFTKDGKRGIRLTDREYIGDIVASSTLGAFKNQSFRINPADPVTFPWLSNVAVNFDEWEPFGFIFEYVPTSSEFNGTSQALGTVITATDYDPTDSAFTNKLVMESADYSRSCRPSCGMEHGIECNLAERGVRTFYTSVSAPTTDLRLTDLGNFQIATLGTSTTNTVLGELWITYDVAFYKKQLVGGQVGANVLDFSCKSTNPTNADSIGIQSNTFIRDGTLNMTLSRVGGNSTRFAFPVTLQTGQYEVSLVASAATGVTFTGNPVAVSEDTTKLLQVATFPGGASTSFLSTSGGAVPGVAFRLAFSVLNGGASFVITDAALQYAGAPSLCEVRIIQIPPLPLSSI